MRCQPVLPFPANADIRALVCSSSAIILGDMDGSVELVHDKKVLARKGGHESVSCITFCAAQKLFAVGGTSSSISIFAMIDDALLELQPLHGHQDSIRSLAFSPDGTHLAGGSEDTYIYVWTVNEENEVPLVLQGHGSWVTSLCFFADGRTLASAGLDNSIHFWCLPHLDPYPDLGFESHGAPVHAMARAPNSNTLVSGGRGPFLMIWDLADLSCNNVKGKVTKKAHGHHDGVLSLAYSCDGEQFCAGGRDGNVSVWSTQEWLLLKVLHGEGPVYCLGFALDAPSIYTGHGGSNQIYSWDISRSQPIDWNAEGAHLVLSLKCKAMAPEVPGNVEEEIEENEDLPNQPPETDAHTSYVVRARDAEFAKKLDQMDGLEDGLYKGMPIQVEGEGLYRPATDAPEPVPTDFDASQFPVTSDLEFVAQPPPMAFARGMPSPDAPMEHSEYFGRKVIATIPLDYSGERQSGWAVAASRIEGDPMHARFHISEEAPWDNAYKGPEDDDDQTGPTQYKKWIISMDQDKQSDNGIYSLATSPDGSLVAVGTNDGCIRFLDPLTGDILRTLKGHSGAVTALAFHSETQNMMLASGSEDNTLMIWDGSKEWTNLILKGHDDLVSAVVFSPDGRNLASCSWDGSVWLWDISKSSGVAVGRHAAPKRAMSVAFFADGQHFISAGNDAALCVWDTAELNGQPKKTLHVHGVHKVMSVTCSPNGQYIASGDSKGTIHVWDAVQLLQCDPTDLNPVKTLTTDGNLVHDLAFLPNCSVLAAACKKELFVYDTETWTSQTWPAPAGAHWRCSAWLKCDIQTKLVVGGGASVSTFGISPLTHLTAVRFTDIDNVYKLQFEQMDDKIPSKVWSPQGAFGLNNRFIKYLSSNPHVSMDEDAHEEAWFQALGLLCAFYNPPSSSSRIEALLGSASSLCPEWVLASCPVFLQAALKACHWEDVRKFIGSVSMATMAINNKITYPQPWQYHYRDWWSQFDFSPVMCALADYPDELQVFLNRNPLLLLPGFQHKDIPEGDDMVVYGSPHFATCDTAPPSAADAEGILADHCVVPFSGICKKSDAGPLPTKSFLQAVVEADDPELFQSRAIVALVTYKWEKFARRFYVRDLIRYLFGLAVLCLLSTHATNGEPKDKVGALIAWLVLFHAMYSMVVAFHRWRVMPYNYHHAWKRMHWVQMLLAAASAGAYFCGAATLPLLLASAAYLGWLGLLYFMQPFHATGALVHTVIEIVRDVRWFFAILGVVVIAGAHAFSILLHQEPGCDANGDSEGDAFLDPVEALFSSFNMLVLTDYDLEPMLKHPHRNYLRILFIISMLLVPIILLNMLIAQMNGSFERITERSAMEVNLLKAKYILEVELMMHHDEQESNEAKNWFPKHLHVFVPHGRNMAVTP